MNATPFVLRRFGSFFVGGRKGREEGLPIEEHLLAPGGVPVRIDPNGTTLVGQMYVQYAEPDASVGRLPLLFWHGGSLTGVTWESTPDGREGWFSWFLRHGWSCYNVDAVERGRSGWAPRDPHFAGPAMLRTLQDSFTQFRVGRRVSSDSIEALTEAAYPDCQFPLAHFDVFMRQIVPRWTTTDDLTIEAYCALLDQVGPAIIIAHSQGGAFAFRAAELRPDKVAAIVAVEPARGGMTDGANLAGIPVLALYGDHLERDARWPQIRARTDAFFAEARTNGARIDVLDLPRQGVTGNSHLLMMERNNADIASRIATWLRQQGLTNGTMEKDATTNV